MSEADGRYLGGIRTIEDLRLRCRVDDITGCWHWVQGISQGAPKVHYVINGKKGSGRGRKAALLLSGIPIPKGHVVFPKRICPSDDCVNPEHSRAGTRNNHGKYLRATGKSISMTKTVAARKSARGKRAKLTIEDARAIRESTESQAKVAKRFGVSQAVVWSIKAGRAWREHAAGASVFEWRPA